MLDVSRFHVAFHAASIFFLIILIIAILLERPSSRHRIFLLVAAILEVLTLAIKTIIPAYTWIARPVGIFADLALILSIFSKTGGGLILTLVAAFAPIVIAVLLSFILTGISLMDFAFVISLYFVYLLYQLTLERQIMQSKAKRITHTIDSPSESKRIPDAAAIFQWVTDGMYEMRAAMVRWRDTRSEQRKERRNARSDRRAAREREKKARIQEQWVQSILDRQLQREEEAKAERLSEPTPMPPRRFMQPDREQPDWKQTDREQLRLPSSGEAISFQRELDDIKRYIAQSNAQQNRTIAVTCNLSVEDFIVPALTIQTIVENAVQDETTDAISISTENIGTYVRITVEDNGSGVDENKLEENLFELRTDLSTRYNGMLQIIRGKRGIHITVILPYKSQK